MSKVVVSCNKCWHEFSEPKYRRETLLDANICPNKDCKSVGTLQEIEIGICAERHWRGNRNGKNVMRGNGKMPKRHAVAKIAV